MSVQISNWKPEFLKLSTLPPPPPSNSIQAPWKRKRVRERKRESLRASACVQAHSQDFFYGGRGGVGDSQYALQENKAPTLKITAI